MRRHATKPSLHRQAIPLVLALALAPAIPARAQNHDLVLEPAPDITSPTSSSDWRSPDIKVGADFGDASVPDLVRRGATNPLFARFYINGVLDYLVPSPAAEIRFYYRDATVGETPPALTAPGAGWHPIGSPLQVTYGGSDPPFILTKTWPTDFPSVATKSVDWTAPATGDLFHIAAEVTYLGGTTDDNPDDNVAVSLYESILGVRDVDLVIVHDLSGSMLYYTYAGSSYLDQAKVRAQAFVAMMNESHRLAVVGFGGCLSGGVTDVWGTPVPPLEAATWANKIAATTSIGGLMIPNLGCATPMGVGIQRAIQILTSVAADPTRKRAILLLTDGYENSGTPRACPGTDPAGPCLGSAVLAQLQAADIRVFSIALGTAAWTQCLECLTDETGGQWYSTPGPGLDLAQVYLDMQETYSADDLYRTDRGVTGGGDDTYKTYFEGLDDVLYFALQSDRLDSEIGLELRPPGGVWQSPGAVANAQVLQGKGFLVVRVEKPASGTWEYRVVGEPRREYLVAVRSDRVGLRLGLGLETEGRVGSPIVIKAHLTDRGKPVQVPGLTATVQLPAASLDAVLRREARRLLHERRIPPVGPQDDRRSPDASPRSAFINLLTDGQPHKLAKTRVVRVRLEPVGDGAYKGVLTGATRIAGEYTVSVDYHGERADRRVSRSVRLAPAGLDFRASFAELLALKQRSGEGERWLVRIYPTDEQGNAISDRSLLKGLRISVRGAKLKGEPQVAYDSAFEQELSVARGQRPALESVTLRGKELRIERDVPGPPR